MRVAAHQMFHRLRIGIRWQETEMCLTRCRAEAGFAFSGRLALTLSMATATAPRPLERPKPRRLWTYAEMCAELEETNLPVELWDGEIIMSPAPKPSHQTVVARFWEALKNHVEPHGLGRVFLSPVDVVLSPRQVVQPDVFFIARERIGIIGNHIAGAPDLAAEVISPGSWRRDRVDKKALYEQFSVKEYWILDPDTSSIEVFVLSKGACQLHCRVAESESARSKLLAGFKVSFNELVV